MDVDLLGEQRFAAFGAHGNRIEDVSALLVFVKQRAAALIHHVDIAPVNDRHHDRVEIETFLGQDIFVPFRRFLISNTPQDAKADQLFQSFGKEVAGDSQCGLESLKSAGPQKTFPQDQQTPTVADDANGAGHGTRLFFKFVPSHGRLRFAAN
jgi:hypothetical protein